MFSGAKNLGLHATQSARLHHTSRWAYDLSLLGKAHIHLYVLKRNLVFMKHHGKSRYVYMYTSHHFTCLKVLFPNLDGLKPVSIMIWEVGDKSHQPMWARINGLDHWYLSTHLSMEKTSCDSATFPSHHLPPPHQGKKTTKTAQPSSGHAANLLMDLNLLACHLACHPLRSVWLPLGSEPPW